jgi:regulation of enolase protein 1 (concanavalin A-like superfamily)
VSDPLNVPELPFPLVPSPSGGWRRDGLTGAVIADAGPQTDLYLNPGGTGSSDAASLLNAATLLGTPPECDFQFRARVTVGFEAMYDAGVLLLWADERNWGKLCFEYSPAGDPMIVSVVTRGVSDDANAFTIAGRSVWLRVSRIDQVYAYHASTDGTTWQLVRVFSIGETVAGHRIGFEAQSPTGDGCTVTFEDICFVAERLGDLRDGS